MTPFTLGLIRDFDLRFDGAKIDVPLSSQRLIAYVALQDRPVRRSRVSSTLWLDSAEDRANASLRSALWHRELGVDAAEGGGVP